MASGDSDRETRNAYRKLAVSDQVNGNAWIGLESSE